MNIQVQENFQLQGFNTFGISTTAKEFVEVNTEEDVSEIVDTNLLANKARLILGGGSNLLFTKNFDGIVLKNNIKGIELLGENDEEVFVQVGAGENWHEFVLHCIDKGWNGVENLSLIPGNVGASPMQNIGAYGVEIKDVFHELEAVRLTTGETHYFSNAACEFGYRESIFKKEMKDQYFITRVTYKLSKTVNLKVAYGAIQEELDRMKVSTVTAKAVSDAVIKIRSSKLPDPKVLGNAGSFFKNPVIEKSQHTELKSKFENLVAYPVGEDKMKLAAGWLIEQAGWKGKRVGNCGVHKLQALVLVNYVGAAGSEIFDLSSEVLAAVKSKFGVELEREVNIY